MAVWSTASALTGIRRAGAARKLLRLRDYGGNGKLSNVSPSVHVPRRPVCGGYPARKEAGPRHTENNLPY